MNAAEEHARKTGKGEALNHPVLGAVWNNIKQKPVEEVPAYIETALKESGKLGWIQGLIQDK